MIVHSIVPYSGVNGPGDRFVLWVQGCRRRCPFCFNPEAQAFEGKGTIMSVDELLALVIESSATAVTVSGGEPFEQSEELYKFLVNLRRLSIHTLVYTGYYYDELKKMTGEAYKFVQKALDQIDIVIDGPYDYTIPARHKWAGSGNQHVYQLKNGSIEKEIIDNTDPSFNGELIIDEDGNIITTGIIENILIKEE